MRTDVSRGAHRVSVVVAALAAVVSALGVFVPSVYRDTSEWIRAVWFGNDLVTLVVAVPTLSVALVLARRGSRLGELMWYGSLGYMIYNFAYYLLGARINALFLAYVVLWVTSAIALMLALNSLDAEKLAGDFLPSWREKVSAGYMAFTGVGLAIAWIAQWAGIVFAGAKSNLGEAGFQLVAAMDLSFMVPFFLIGAVQLWRRRAWGFVIAPVIMVQGALYTLVLATNAVVLGVRGLPGSGELPVWATWTVVGACALATLLAGAKGEER